MHTQAYTYISVHFVQIVVYHAQFCALFLSTLCYHGANSVSECTELILIFNGSIDFLRMYVSSFSGGHLGCSHSLSVSNMLQ